MKRSVMKSKWVSRNDASYNLLTPKLWKQLPVLKKDQRDVHRRNDMVGVQQCRVRFGAEKRAPQNWKGIEHGKRDNKTEGTAGTTEAL